MIYANTRVNSFTIFLLSLFYLRYNINAKIKDIVSTLKPFGFVSIGPSPPSVVIKTMKAKQAHIMSVIQYPYVK